MKKARRTVCVLLSLIIVLSSICIAQISVMAYNNPTFSKSIREEYVTMYVGEIRLLPGEQAYDRMVGTPSVTDDSQTVVSYKRIYDQILVTAEKPGKMIVAISITSTNGAFTKESVVRYHFTVNGGSSNTNNSDPKPGDTSFTSVTYNGSDNILKWTSAGNATKYRIARLKTGDSQYTYLGTTDTSGKESGVTPGIKYTYQVQAINGSTQGNWSKSVTVVTLTKPSLKASNKSNGIRAEWNAVNGATQYKVFYKSEYDSGWSSVTTSNTYYPLLNTVPGRKYAFQVQPVGKTSDILGPYSSVVNIVYANAGMSTKPALTVSNKSNGIRLEWNSISGATSYVVYYRKASVSTWSSTTTTNNYYPFLSAQPGTAYCFQVLPMFGSSKGTYSDVKSITFTTAGMSTKPALTVSNKSNGIRLEWNSISGATSYVVYYRKASVSTWSSTTTTNNYYPFLSAQPGTAYCFQVLPMFGSSKGTYSDVRSITFTTAAMNTKPTLTLSNKSNGIRLEWDSVSGATSYVVYYRKASISTWSSTTTTNNYYPFLSAQPGTAYCFQVLPMFGSSKGTYSSVKSITYTKATNEKPTLTVSCKTNGIRVEWNSVSGATSYIVYYKEENSSTWSQTETKNTYYPYLDAKVGTSYSFQVQPVFNGEKGAYSSKWTLFFTPIVDNSLAAPTTSTKIDYGIDVTWTSVSGATGYVVQCMNYDSEQRDYVYTTGNYKWFSSSSLEKGHYYTCWVRAYKTNGNSTTYGPWSNGSTIYYN